VSFRVAVRCAAALPDTVRRNPVNSRQHALLARELIRLCGGLDEATGACRLGRSRLAEFRDPASGAFMPADVLADLEAYNGDPVYSRALAEDRPAACHDAGPLTEACEIAEGSAQLQKLVRLALKDGRVSRNDATVIETYIACVQDELRQLRAAIERGAS
jgi:hypothetical protein